MKIKITPIQFEILEHRLDIPDCIYECQIDTDGAVPCTEEEVNASTSKLKKMAKAGTIDVSTLSELDKEVLEDSVNGSTIMDGIEAEWDAGQISNQKHNGYKRSFYNLECKLRSAGLNV